MSDAPTRSHNNPPGQVEPEPIFTADGLLDQITAAWAHLAKRTEERLAGFERFKTLTENGFPSADVRAKANDFYKQLSDEAKLIEGVRKQVGKPLLDATAVVNTFFLRTMVEPLNAAAAVVRQRCTVYDQEVKRQADEAIRQRRLQEETAEKARQAEIARQAEAAAQTGDDAALDAAIAAEQAAAEAAPQAPIAAPSAADATRIRGTDSVSSLSGRWVVEITDPTLIPREYLMPNMVKIEAEMKSSRIKNGPPTAKIPGVVFKQEQQTRFR